MRRAAVIVFAVVAFLALVGGAICFQASYFYLSEPAPVEFYAAIMKAEDKSLARTVLPLLVAGPSLALVGIGLLWWSSRDAGLKNAIRWTGVVLAVIWFILCLNFLGYVRILPAGILPGPPPGWTSVSQINAPFLLRMYFRMFRPGLGIAPIDQGLPWLPAIASFPVVAFLVTFRPGKGALKCEDVV